MCKQNEITASLVNQQRLLSLPPRDIPVFEGDPFQYKAFIKSFEQGVEDKASKADCLYYLEQFTRGQPRELVQSCQHMDAERGFIVAKALLQEHFGNEYKIANAYIEKALTWPAIKSEDVKSLQAYGLFLGGCCNAMEELPHMQEMDMPSNMKTVVCKLPYKYRERWRAVAHDIMEKYNQRAHFVDVVAFLEKQVRILSDPIFGNIEPPVPQNVTASKPCNNFKMQTKSFRGKGSSFATTVMPVNSSEEKAHTSNAKRQDILYCSCCTRAHLLEKCQQFQRKKHRERIRFLKEKGICFGCLKVGHISCDCKKRLVCEVCEQQHPTALHIPKTNVEWQRTWEPPEENPSTSSQVKSTKGIEIIQTYAFLDPGSTATFCSEHLMQRLNITGKITNFLLKTMGQEKVVPTFAVSGMEVADLAGKSFYPLPEVLTQREMPVTPDNIVTAADLERWPYLSKVHIFSIKANVDLLIGTNAPRLLEPWEVVNSCGYGPYAIRTVLGWVINGPLNGKCSNEMKLSSIVVNRISVSNLEIMLNNQHKRCLEKTKFMEIMESSATLQEERYCL
ncbi:hypothetical protein N1851_002884 [Merluccius polli]|uniref:Peptidase aspartic putative domain-containing protein n=1 Tax=Merluccius polli TaxID=89951 RepID=A0AA47N991_MERPO|nr:hypothetical protein N1851_002884 [Merluccius polli]